MLKSVKDVGLFTILYEPLMVWRKWYLCVCGNLSVTSHLYLNGQVRKYFVSPYQTISRENWCTTADQLCPHCCSADWSHNDGSLLA